MLFFAACTTPVQAQTPGSAGLQLEQTDVVVSSGAVGLLVHRALGEGGVGLLGAHWRLNWESRIASRGSSYVVTEGVQQIEFAEIGGAHLGPPGERITKEADGVLVRQRGDLTRDGFDARGRLAWRDFGNGNRVTLSYDGADRLIRVDGPRGIFLAFMLDAAGHAVRITSSSGEIATYSYSGNDLVAVETPTSPPIRYRYGNGRLTRIEDPAAGAVEFTYDGKGRVTSRRLADGTTDRWEFDDAAGGVRYVDPSGAITTTVTSANGLRREQTDAIGRKTVTEFDPAGQPIAITGPDRKTVRLTYDQFGRLSQIQDGLGGTMHLSYVGQSALVAEVDGPGDTRQTFDYDAARNLLAMKENGRTITSMSYGPDGQLVRYAMQGRPERKFEYDAAGLLTAMVDALGQRTRFDYDRSGRLRHKIDSLGGTTSYAYDNKGRRFLETTPAGASLYYRYDAGGRMISKSGPGDSQETYDFDARGRQIGITNMQGQRNTVAIDAVRRTVTRHEAAPFSNPAVDSVPVDYCLYYGKQCGEPAASAWCNSQHLGKAVSFTVKHGVPETRVLGDGLICRAVPNTQCATFASITCAGASVAESTRFDQAGRAIEVTDGLGRITRYEYDASDRVTAIHLGGGRTITYRYDARGRLVASDDGLGGSLHYQWGDAGIAAVTDGTGARAQFRVDAQGRVTSVVDPAGGERRFAYDANGNVVEVRSAAGDTAGFEYDREGRMTAVRLPTGGMLRYERDAKGAIVALHNADGTTVRSSYDRAGNLVAVTDAMGRRTDFTYGANGRIDSMRLPDGTAVSYRYAADGTLIEADDQKNPVRRTLDRNGQIATIEWPAIRKSLGFTHDSAGRVTEITGSAGQKIDYRYDNAGHLAAIALPGGGEIALSYDIGDRLQQVRYPNGVHGDYTYRPTGEVRSLAWIDREGHTLASWAYSYDSRGNVTSVERSPAAKLELGHDADSRLIDERAGARVVHYEYRAGGDRSKRIVGTATTSYGYDDGGRLVAAGEERFGYDGAGNITDRSGPSGKTVYKFDALGHLVRAMPAAGTPVTFDYAANGERISRRDANGLVHFLYGGNDLIEEVGESGESLAFYVHGPGLDRPLAMIRGNQTYYYHADAQGTIALITDSRGSPAATYETDAFGTLLSPLPALANPFIYAGREYEPTLGLYYNRARYYDPALGRYLSVDPFPGDQSKPAALNRYAYALNAPTRYSDPFGLAPDEGATAGPGVLLINGSRPSQIPQPSVLQTRPVVPPPGFRVNANAAGLPQTAIDAMVDVVKQKMQQPGYVLQGQYTVDGPNYLRNVQVPPGWVAPTGEELETQAHAIVQNTIDMFRDGTPQERIAGATSVLNNQAHVAEPRFWEGRMVPEEWYQTPAAPTSSAGGVANATTPGSAANPASRAPTVAVPRSGDSAPGSDTRRLSPPSEIPTPTLGDFFKNALTGGISGGVTSALGCFIEGRSASECWSAAGSDALKGGAGGLAGTAITWGLLKAGVSQATVKALPLPFLTFSAGRLGGIYLNRVKWGSVQDKIASGDTLGAADLLVADIELARRAVNEAAKPLNDLLNKANALKSKLDGLAQADMSGLSSQCSQAWDLLDHMNRVAANAAQSEQNVVRLLDPEHPNKPAAEAELNNLKAMLPDMEHTARELRPLVQSITAEQKSRSQQLTELSAQYAQLEKDILAARDSLMPQVEAFHTLQANVLAKMDAMRANVRNDPRATDMYFFVSRYQTIRLGTDADSEIETALKFDAFADIERWRTAAKQPLPANCNELVTGNVMAAIDAAVNKVRDLVAKAQTAWDNRPTCEWSKIEFKLGTTAVETLSVSSNYLCVLGNYHTDKPEDRYTARTISAASHGLVTPRGVTGWAYQSYTDYKGPDRFMLFLWSTNSKTGKKLMTTVINNVTVK